jgi:subtilisin family serine protease
VTRRIAALAVLLAAAVPASAAAAPPDSYIVTLKDGVSSSAVAAEHRSRLGADVRFVYTAALNGYAARIEDGRVDAVRRDSRVARIERDGIATKSVTQSGATWGLDRIDQRALPLSTSYTYNATGSGVTAYIIDTGIRFSHPEFGGRATSGSDFIDGGTADDCDGHGTHVAGTTGGATWGVAKAVSLVSVRVLDCAGNGSWSGVIAGIDWVTSHHAPGAPAVANMSLGGGAITAVDTAVRNSIADGVSYAVAAGNGNRGGVGQDACAYSPARVAEAMTISATDRYDRRASFGNYGACVDWFAPGVGITSSVMSGGSEAWNGTSMATPHTTGVAALYLQSNRGALPATVRSVLFSNATKGIVTSSKTTNNHLLFTNGL